MLMSICVVGCGYVGMATAVAIAKNERVVIYDKDINKLKNFYNGRVEFNDEELKKTFLEHRDNLNVEYNEDNVVDNSDVFILAISTDYDEKYKKLNTSSLERWICKLVTQKRDAAFRIVIKSTVPIGFAEKMRKKYGFEYIFSVPEFLREGRAFSDIINPTRIVVGGDKTEIEDVIELIYSKDDTKDIRYVSTTEAEAIKLFANAYLSMRISFFNELDEFSERNGIDTKRIIDGICADPRIGDYYNNPSFGYGGYCLPKDTKQLAHQVSENGILINSISKSNENRKKEIVRKIASKGDKIGVYRLQMKKNSDNMRGAVILEIINELIKNKKKVAVYEPFLEIPKMLNEIIVCNSLKELSDFSDIIVANRIDEEILRYKEKVYTRDIFLRD